MTDLLLAPALELAACGCQKADAIGGPAEQRLWRGLPNAFRRRGDYQSG